MHKTSFMQSNEQITTWEVFSSICPKIHRRNSILICGFWVSIESRLVNQHWNNYLICIVLHFQKHLLSNWICHIDSVLNTHLAIYIESLIVESVLNHPWYFNLEMAILNTYWVALGNGLINIQPLFNKKSISNQYHVPAGQSTRKPVSWIHTGKCIRRFGGIYTYCRYFIDRKW